MEHGHKRAMVNRLKTVRGHLDGALTGPDLVLVSEHGSRSAVPLPTAHPAA